MSPQHSVTSQQQSPSGVVKAEPKDHSPAISEDNHGQISSQEETMQPLDLSLRATDFSHNSSFEQDDSIATNDDSSQSDLDYSSESLVSF